MYQAIIISGKLFEQRVNMKTMLGEKNKVKDQKQKSLLELGCQKQKITRTTNGREKHRRYRKISTFCT